MVSMKEIVSALGGTEKAKETFQNWLWAINIVYDHSRKTGDSRLPGHSYSGYTEYLRYKYGGKVVDFEVRMEETLPHACLCVACELGFCKAPRFKRTWELLEKMFYQKNPSTVEELLEEEEELASEEERQKKEFGRQAASLAQWAGCEWQLAVAFGNDATALDNFLIAVDAAVNWLKKERPTQSRLNDILWELSCGRARKIEQLEKLLGKDSSVLYAMRGKAAVHAVAEEVVSAIYKNFNM